jgi:hypothetical protein
MYVYIFIHISFYSGNTPIEQFDINDLKSLNNTLLDEKMNENENLKNLKLHFFKKIIGSPSQTRIPDIRNTDIRNTDITGFTPQQQYLDTHLNDKIHIDNNIKKLNLNDKEIKAIRRYALHVKTQPAYKTFNVYPLPKYLISYKYIIVIIMLFTFTSIILSTIIMSIYQVFFPDPSLQGNINPYMYL